MGLDELTAVQMVKKKELSIDPTELRFNSKGGLLKVSATNNTDGRLVVKVYLQLKIYYKKLILCDMSKYVIYLFIFIKILL